MDHVCFGPFMFRPRALYNVTKVENGFLFMPQ